MLFRRRSPLPLFQKLRQAFWPRAGWRRTAIYVSHRVRRLPGTPGHIAAGFACGAAVSFTPFLGLHFVSAALLALLLRGSLLASAIGTVVGNPWTFPLIWAWIYTLGCLILGSEHAACVHDSLSLTELERSPFTTEYLRDNILVFGLPMTVGGLPTALVAWFAFYWPVKAAVASYQTARRKRLENPRYKRHLRKLEKAAMKKAGREKAASAGAEASPAEAPADRGGAEQARQGVPSRHDA